MIGTKKRKRNVLVLEEEEEQTKNEKNDGVPQWVKVLRENSTRAFMRELRLTDHDVQSFNVLIETYLKDIIENNGRMVIQEQGEEDDDRTKVTELVMNNYRFVYGSAEPPSKCHLYSSTYEAEIFVDIKKTVYYDGDDEMKEEGIREETTYKNFHLCNFPIMLHSNACHHGLCNDFREKETEHGGVFIINGKRRYVPLLRDIVRCYPFLFKNPITKGGGIKVHVRSNHVDRSDKLHRSTSTLEIMMLANTTTRKMCFNPIVFSVPFLDQRIPLDILVKAMGWNSNEFCDAVQCSFPDLWEKHKFKCDMYLLSTRASSRTSEECLAIVASFYKREDTQSVRRTLRTEILPHLNSSPDPEDQKLIYIAYCVAMLVLYREGVMHTTDRDLGIYMRVIDGGSSLAQLFRMKFLSYMRLCTNVYKRAAARQGKKPIDLKKVINEKRFSTQIRSAIATGNWSRQKRGVSHPLNTGNIYSIISQTRKINSPKLQKDGMHIEERMLRPILGYECPAETPEGQGCGLIRSLASTTRVSMASDPQIAAQVFMHHVRLLSGVFLEATKANALKKKDSNVYRLFGPWGEIVGFATDIGVINRLFSRLRQTLAIDPTVTKFQDDVRKEWRIETDSGRLIRPLIVVDRLKESLCILNHQALGHMESIVPELLARGVVEYVSAAEETNLNVTFDYRDVLAHGTAITHLEMCDFSFVGIIASLAPFFRHNQGPRLSYWCSMMKQQIVQKAYNTDLGGCNSHSLWYGHKALVRTKAAEHLQLENVRGVTNCTIAVMPGLYNEEDALIVNRAAVERGMFISSSLRQYTCNKKTTTNVTSERFEKPDPKTTSHLQHAKYDKLEENGIPKVGTRVEGGDIVIGKTVPLKKINSNANANVPKSILNNERRKDMSVKVRKGESGSIETATIIRKKNADCDMGKVSVLSTCYPEIGDKISSRHSQKGTIAIMRPPEDLPFSMQTGMIPDIIMSPLGFTSRMTMGKMMEILGAKAACLSGDLDDSFDDQSFTGSVDKKMEHLQSVLNRYGFAKSGKEIFIDGTTGNMIEMPVFTGVVSYAKLGHMVKYKMHSRSMGPVHQLTRQPVEGRRGGGGLRFGAMESECVISHSASETLREKSCFSSDQFEVYVCSTCGQIAEGNRKINHFWCTICEARSGIRIVTIPYATKLLMQELNCLGVDVSLKTKDELRV